MHEDLFVRLGELPLGLESLSQMVSEPKPCSLMADSRPHWGEHSCAGASPRRSAESSEAESGLSLEPPPGRRGPHSARDQCLVGWVSLSMPVDVSWAAFLAARFCLIVVPDFFDIVARGDLSAMTTPSSGSHEAPGR
ncbi:MAG: hypothetical protein JWR66_4072 [Modestobacter sp.]|nr:hypothetical protein [Modestobacter sp.]